MAECSTVCWCACLWMCGRRGGGAAWAAQRHRCHRQASSPAQLRAVADDRHCIGCGFWIGMKLLRAERERSAAVKSTSRYADHCGSAINPIRWRFDPPCVCQAGSAASGAATTPELGIDRPDSGGGSDRMDRPRLAAAPNAATRHDHTPTSINKPSTRTHSHPSTNQPSNQAIKQATNTHLHSSHPIPPPPCPPSTRLRLRPASSPPPSLPSRTPCSCRARARTRSTCSRSWHSRTSPDPSRPHRTWDKW